VGKEDETKRKSFRVDHKLATLF